MALKPCQEFKTKISTRASIRRLLIILPLLGFCIVGASSASADKADEYYDELIEWVFKPCLAVSVALQVGDLDQESRDMGIGHSYLAALALADRQKAFREVAETLASGSKNPNWEGRRNIYAPLLRACLTPYLNKEK